MAASVQKDIYGIGLNNIGYAYDDRTLLPNDGLQVLPIDTDADGRISDSERFYADKRLLTVAIADGRYPSPPARDLYLVSRGVPASPVVRAFIEYVLGPGQQKNEPAVCRLFLLRCGEAVGDGSSCRGGCVWHEGYSVTACAEVGDGAPVCVGGIGLGEVVRRFYDDDVFGYELEDLSLGAVTSFRYTLHSLDLRADVARRIVPGAVAYVYLVHHVVPLSLCHLVIIFVTELAVSAEAELYLVCPFVGSCAAHLGVVVVHGLCVVHVVEVCHGSDGEVDELVVGVAAVDRH